MNPPEGHIEQAERHVRENAGRVARQKELVSELHADAHKDILPIAEKFLIQLEAAQEASIAHLAFEQRVKREDDHQQSPPAAPL